MVTHFSIHAVEAILEDKETLTVLLRNIQHPSGLYVYSTEVTEEEVIAIISQKIGRDFDDSLGYCAEKKPGAESIVSYDKHFEGLDIQRKEPKGILEDTAGHN